MEKSSERSLFIQIIISLAILLSQWEIQWQAADNIKKENWHHLNKVHFAISSTQYSRQNSFSYLLLLLEIFLQRGMECIPQICFFMRDKNALRKAAVVLYGNFQIQSFIFFLFESYRLLNGFQASSHLNLIQVSDYA